MKKNIFLILAILLLFWFNIYLFISRNSCLYSTTLFKIIDKTFFLDNSKKVATYFILLDPWPFIINNDFNKVSNIRNIVSCIAPSASPSVQIKEEMKNKKNSWEMLKFVINSNDGGLDCDGYSTLLLYIYEKFGYQTIAYNYGRLDGFNHVVNLVRIYYGGKYIWSIQDGLFNLSIMDTNNKPLDFLSFIQHLATNSKFKYNLGNNRTHKYYCTYDCQAKVDSYSKKGQLKWGEELINEEHLFINIKKFLYLRHFDSLHSKNEANDLSSQLKNVLDNNNIFFDNIE